MPAGRARHLALLAPLLLLLAGCSALPDDPPEPAPDCTTAPRARTTAELLVGKWTVVEFNGKVVPETWHMTWEFLANGQARVTFDCALRPERSETCTGTYRLTGQTIYTDIEGSPDTWAVTIHSISEDTLVVTEQEAFTARSEQTKNHEVLKRVTDK